MDWRAAFEGVRGAGMPQPVRRRRLVTEAGSSTTRVLPPLPKTVTWPGGPRSSSVRPDCASETFKTHGNRIGYNWSMDTLRWDFR
jgi:hypothetical protein